MPFGVVDPLAALLVLVAGPGGERQNHEAVLLPGCVSLGVLADIAFQRNVVFKMCHHLFSCLDLPGSYSGHSCTK